MAWSLASGIRWIGALWATLGVLGCSGDDAATDSSNDGTSTGAADTTGTDGSTSGNATQADDTSSSDTTSTTAATSDASSSSGGGSTGGSTGTLEQTPCEAYCRSVDQCDLYALTQEDNFGDCVSVCDSAGPIVAPGCTEELGVLVTCTAGVSCAELEAYLQDQSGSMVCATELDDVNQCLM